MRALFVLPAPVRVPMGGAAVVYRHASGLAARGHDVTVAAPRRGAGVRGRAIRAAVVARDRLQGVAPAPLYARPGVSTVEVETPGELRVDGFDAVIATGHQTAPWVDHAMGGRPQGRFYFLQADERRLSPRAEGTWHLPFVRVAVARWLADELDAHGVAVEAVVPNAVDPDDFFLTCPLSDREARVVALYHRHPVKGPDTLVDTLGRVLTARPDIGVDVIAARTPSHRLPPNATVHLRPDVETLRGLYNRASLCLHTSREEGWGLVPMEAAACGCAVVATASRGVSEFLVDGRSMRQVPVGDASRLAAEVVDLMGDRAARVRLATAAREDVARFTWDDSTDRFESVLLEAAPS